MIETNDTCGIAQKIENMPGILQSTLRIAGHQPIDTPSKFIGSFKGSNGSHVFIEKGHALDYASMRISHLQALLALEDLAQDCNHSTISKEMGSNFRWLAATLAQEIQHLIDIVDADARDKASAERGAK